MKGAMLNNPQQKVVLPEQFKELRGKKNVSNRSSRVYWWSIVPAIS